MDSMSKTVIVNGVIYEMGDYLASGLLGTVFPAWETGHDPDTSPPDKAVKVPAPNLPDTFQRKFWGELDTIQSLRRKWMELHPGTSSPFPLAEKGVLQSSREEVLVMEYIPNEAILGRVFKDSTHLDGLSPKRELWFLHAAQRYAEMLACLHETSIACTDRKAPDIRWRGTQDDGSLVVIDWNVVTDNSPENVQQEYARFGSMWYQFLVSRVPPATLDVWDDDAWNGVTMGTRLLLHKLMSGAFYEDRQLQEAIEEILKAWAKTPEALHQDAKDIRSEIAGIEKDIHHGRPSQSRHSLEDLYWQELVTIDLSCKKGHVAACTEREEYIQHVMERWKRFAFTAQQALWRGKYDQGIRSMDNLMQWLRKAEDPALTLTIRRWYVLLRAGKDAVDSQQPFKEIGEQFARWLETLPVSKPWGQSHFEKFPQESLEAFPLLQILHHEWAFRKHWKESHNLVFAETHAQDQYRQALFHVQELDKHLQHIEERDPAYARLLRKTFPDLETWRGEVKTRVNVEEGYRDTPEQAVSKSALEKVEQYLQLRLRDAPWLDERKVLLKEILRESTVLGEYLGKYSNTGALPNDMRIREFLLKLASSITAIPGQDALYCGVASIMRGVPFPPGIEGISARLELAQKLENIPNPKIKHLRMSLLREALAAILRLTGKADTLHPERVPDIKVIELDIQKFTQEIRDLIEAYEKIQKALRENQWNKAHETALRKEIVIYDPLVAAHLAQEASGGVERASKDIQEAIAAIRTSHAEARTKYEEIESTREKVQELNAEISGFAKKTQTHKASIDCLRDDVQQTIKQIEQWLATALATAKQARDDIAEAQQQIEKAIEWINDNAPKIRESASDAKKYRGEVQSALDEAQKYRQELSPLIEDIPEIPEAQNTIRKWVREQQAAIHVDIIADFAKHLNQASSFEERSRHWMNTSQLREAFLVLNSLRDDLNKETAFKLRQSIKILQSNLPVSRKAQKKLKKRRMYVSKDRVEQWQKFLEGWLQILPSSNS